MNNENCGCKLPGAKLPTTPACASTQVPGGPRKAPSYSRACLRGSPMLSPLRIERAARAEHLWTRRLSVTVAVGGPLPVGSVTVVDVVFPAFTSSGSACLTNVGVSVNGTPVDVPITGIAAVWDFTDSSPDWTARVAIPCEVETLGLQTAAGRCPCKVDCEGCLYPEGVGGLFMVRYRVALTLALNDVVVFTASGEHTPGEPCCTLPLQLNEAPVVLGPYPAVQAVQV